MNAIPEKYLHSVCEVKTLENELLCIGKVHGIGDSTLEIVSSNGESLPLIAYHTPVKISIYGGDSDMLVVGGSVYIAHEKLWRISEVNQYQNFERRDFFRVKVTCKGEGIRHVEPELNQEIIKENMTENEEERPFEVSVVNISLCGILFACEERFRIHDEVDLSGLRLIRQAPEFSFHCKIRRLAGENRYGTLYGCTFENMTQRATDDLCKAIFELQREELKKRRN